MARGKSYGLVALAAAVCGLAAITPALRAEPAPVAATTDAATIARGEYLTRAADCEVCHTGPGARPYSGGLPMRTPFGTIWSSNLTPDAQTGIGTWTAAQFSRAVRRGIRADGQHLYPAMPYTSYVQLTDADVVAIYAYLHSLAPVRHAVRQDGMGFPYNQRVALAGWNAINFDPAPFRADPAQSAVWNRGKYVAVALGHCQECHTPRNLAMGLGHAAYAGATVDGWQAYNITSSPSAGIGTWSEPDLERYLSTGALAGKATAAGGMADVIGHSLRYLTPADLTALATYVKSIPPQGADGTSRFAFGAPHDVAAIVRDPAQTHPSEGAQLYAGNCASCHGRAGAGGGNSYYPSLFHNSATGATAPNNLVQVILNGVHRTGNQGQAIAMPAFASQLDDAQAAALANYLIDTYGRGAGKVGAGFVASERSGAVAVIPGWLLIGAPVLLVLLALVFIIWRRRSLKRSSDNA